MNQNESKSKLDSLFFQDDVFSYRNMHDLIQALILADEEDIAERLQQLRKVFNDENLQRSRCYITQLYIMTILLVLSLQYVQCNVEFIKFSKPH